MFFSLLPSLLNVLPVGVIHVGTCSSSSLAFQFGILFNYLDRNDGHLGSFQNPANANSSAVKIPVHVFQSMYYVRDFRGGISGL